MAGRRFRNRRNVLVAHMKSGRHVEPEIDGGDDRVDPVGGQYTPGISDAEDQRARTAFLRSREVHVTDPDVGPAAGKAELPHAPFTPPVDDAGSRLRRKLVMYVTEKEEKGRLEFHDGFTRVYAEDHMTDTCLMVVKARMPSLPPSRPKPLSLTPPNGVSGSEARQLLMLTVPASICRAAALATSSRLVIT